MYDQTTDNGYPSDPSQTNPNSPTPDPPPPDPTAPADTPPPGGGGGGGGGAVGPVGLSWPAGMDRSPIYNFTAAPGFDAPKFNAPNSSTAWDDPGYQFRLKSGSDALQRSAAARGTLRTGGTLKDIMDYGQNFASQEYGNIYNRALQNYNTEYQGAKDTYAPKFSDWQMGQNAELSRGNQAFARQWDLYALANNLQMSKDSLAGQLLSTPPA